MLGDQWSPYVGRFARGWRRLPGRIPGQPQTRTRALSRIGTVDTLVQRGRPRRQFGKGPSGDDQMHPAGPGDAERLRARRRGCPGREDIVHEQDAGWRGAERHEGPSHRASALRPATAGLGGGGDRAPKEWPGRDGKLAAQCDREGASLIVAPLGEAATSERHPGEHVGGRWIGGGHRARQRRGHAFPPGELQPVDRGLRGTFVQERCPGARQRLRGTVRTTRDGDRTRSPAPRAPRRLEGLQC
jgi:hypothetical protein